MSDIMKAVDGMVKENYKGFIIVDSMIKYFINSTSYSSQDFYFIDSDISKVDVYCQNRLDNTIEFKGIVDIDMIYDYDNEYDKDYLYGLSVKESYSNFELLENYNGTIYFIDVQGCKTVKDYVID
jgi:hypothetical protein